MPILKSAKKALRQARRNKSRNDKERRSLHEVVKAFRKNPSKKLLDSVYSAADLAVKKHIIHKNKASRLKKSSAKLVG